MKIYIDSDYKCHTTNPDDTFREVEHPFFAGKCGAFIEGYCYEPDSENIYPWKDYAELDNAQREYEKALIADMQNALNKLGVTLDA